ncbi:hypothetical protein BACPU_13310 [Bacillus pumilus]|nr:hypothetical protein BACPU_13310 [Bacillus pumilus]
MTAILTGNSTISVDSLSRTDPFAEDMPPCQYHAIHVKLNITGKNIHYYRLIYR